MLKFIQTGDIKYKGQLFRGRQIIGTEETLALIYPLRNKAIFTSGWRSKVVQAEMVKKGASKTMDSNHCRGVAYDIWNWSEMEKEMRKLGFKNEISWDLGHFPFGGEDAARKNYKIISSLPKILDEYKPKKEAKKEPTPIKKAKEVKVPKIEPIVPVIAKQEQIMTPQEVVKPIKLSELPKIEEVTAIGEFKKLILDIFNFIISKLK